MTPRHPWRLAVLGLLLAAPCGAAPSSIPVPAAVRRYVGQAEVFVTGDEHLRGFGTPAWRRETEAAVAAAREALPDLASSFHVPVERIQPVFLVVAPDDSRLHMEAPSWSAAVAHPEAHLIVLSGPSLHAARLNLRETVEHELVHLILQARIGAAGWMPRWLHEGLAVEASGYGRWSDRLITWGRGPVHLSELTDTFPAQPESARLAYLESLAAVRRLLRRGPIEPLLARLAAGEEFDVAFAAVYGESPETFADAVAAEVSQHWRVLPLLTSGTSLFALMTALLFLAAWRKRRERRRQLAAWARAEMEESARQPEVGRGTFAADASEPGEED